MTNSIVVENVTQIVAPAPNLLQSTGAFVSQGGTTLAPNASSLLTARSDLTPLLRAPLALSSITQSGGVATATTAATTIASGVYDSGSGLVTLTLTADIGLKPGSSAVVSAVTGSGSFADVDGTYVAAVGTSGTTLTYTIAPSLTLTIATGNVGAGLAVTAADTFLTTIAGSTVLAYNGTVLATAVTSTTFTYLVPAGTASPATGSPTFTPRNVAELQAMANTFFDQGVNQGVYVLELGPGEPAAGVTALAAYIALNPNTDYAPGETGYYYGYLVPRSWADESSYWTFCNNYNVPTSKVYFFTTMTLSNYTNFTKLMKCVVGMVEAPGIPTSEFSLAGFFYDVLGTAPSSTNKVSPFAFRFQFGVTAYPTYNNGPTLATLRAANVNVIGFGGEGGISENILKWGTAMDGNQFNYWYSGDWLQIQVDEAIANAVINGSNTPSNPLYYNQDGINRLQLVAANTMSDGVTYGLGLGTVIQTELDQASFNQAVNTGAYAGNVVINAIPFLPYVTANPSDYPIGRYGGFTVVWVTQNGFINIIFNIDVTDIVTL